MIKILSWNIRQGGGSRVQPILSFLQNAEADIIIFSEFRNNKKGALLRSELITLGYRYHCVTAAPAEVNSVLIASRFPGDSKLHLDSDHSYGNNIVEFNLGPFSILGAYFPHKKKHTLFDYVIEMCEQEQPIVLCGDLNSGINGVDQKGSSFWYEEEFKQLLDGPMIDAYRKCHGDKREYSWFSHQGNGYRYDHSLLSTQIAFLVDSCFYLPEALEKKLSDHAPMMLVLRPQL